jgi:hypothetical protein
MGFPMWEQTGAMNQLKWTGNNQQSIIGLYRQGWSKRRIARALQLDRVTVRKYLAPEISKSPTPHTGSNGGMLSSSIDCDMKCRRTMILAVNVWRYL